MKDIKLTDDWDFDLSNNDMHLISGSEETGQNINISLLFIRSEYIFDVTLGVPWMDGMLGSGWLEVEREYEIRETILQREGVVRLNQFRFTVDAQLHTAYVQYAVETLYGTSISTLPVSLVEE